VVLRFGDVELDVDAYEIRRAGARVHVEPQVFDVVRYLVTHRDRVVTKAELLDEVWCTRFVSESSLTSRVKAARRALGDDGREQRVIRTVHGRGYQFVAPLVGGDRVAAGDGRPPGQPVLEREDALALLHAALLDAAGGHGRIVTIAGEPGMGKTTVLRSFLAGIERGRSLVGRCDDLVTPLPLGPFHDIARHAAPAVGDAVANPTQGAVQQVLLAELASSPSPVVLAVEDVHWADAATIDVLSYLSRRIADLPALLVMTYRAEELVGAHPLVLLLGAVPAEVTRRIDLAPLSPHAVAELVGEERAAGVLAATGGVPFFVAELAAMGTDPDAEALPASVAHAVVARVARLPDATAQLLDLLAVEPSRTDVALLDELRPDWMTELEPAERGGIVALDEGAVGFRHDLARRAVLDDIPAARRHALHRRVAQALVATGADPARVVHHAEAGGDLPLLAEQALLAAHRATAASAHREADAHYRRVLPLLQHFPRERHAGVLEAASHAAYNAGDTDAALELALRALAAHRASGDELSTGRVHIWLSRIRWFQARRVQAEVQGQLAVQVLERLPPSVELAWAYSNRSQLAMLAWQHKQAVEWGDRAIRLAGDLHADDVVVHAMVNVGAARVRFDSTDQAMLWEAVAMAKAMGDHHEAVRAMIAVSYTAMVNDVPLPAREVAEKALRHAEQYEVETLRRYLIVMLARVDVMEGRWDDAERALRAAVETESSVPLLLALGSLALVQVRRGDKLAAADSLARAWPLADAAAEPQRIVPLAEVELERAWLAGDVRAARPRLQRTAALSGLFGGHLGRIIRWQQELGELSSIPDGVPEPYLAELEGRWADAARQWRARGMPYEEALALARTDHAGRGQAIAIAERLGAAPLLRLLRR
jgi:DNA-binding winged helix-turn-helix (wHTH) protein/tetratricopeptide (TPR) repeat protein